MKNILYAVAAALLIISASGAFGAESGTINLTVVDQETGKPIPFRLYLKTPKGTGRRLPNLPFWTDHNTIDSGRLDLKLPTGYYEFEIESSPEYTTRKGRLDMPRNGSDAQTVSLQRVGRMREEGWACADLDNWRSVLEMPVLSISVQKRLISRKARIPICDLKPSMVQAICSGFLPFGSRNCHQPSAHR